MTGFNLPPGCDTLPGDIDYGCQICLQYEDKCICPECPTCGEHGNPECYGFDSFDMSTPYLQNFHGLRISDEQKKSKIDIEKEMEDQAKSEIEWEQKHLQIDEER